MKSLILRTAIGLFVAITIGAAGREQALALESTLVFSHVNIVDTTGGPLQSLL